MYGEASSIVSGTLLACSHKYLIITLLLSDSLVLTLFTINCHLAHVASFLSQSKED